MPDRTKASRARFDTREAVEKLQDVIRRLLIFRPAATLEHLRRVAAVPRALPDDVLSNMVERLRDDYIARKRDESLRRVARRW